MFNACTLVVPITLEDLPVEDFQQFFWDLAVGVLEMMVPIFSG
jgi:hypothetical protein